MSLESLGNLGEFLSAIVVVISLFYLAYQVRQNTHSLHTESYARTLERVAGIQSQLAGDPALASILWRGVFDERILEREERIQFSWLFYEMFGAFEFMFHQAQKGVLPDEVWERWSSTMAWWLSLPGVAAWWRSVPAPFTTSFTAEVETTLARGTDPEAAQRFIRFLQEQRPQASGP